MGRAVFDTEFLDVGLPMRGGFAVAVADEVARHFAFITDTAYFGHRVYVPLF